jgi:Lon protease-like protein
MASPFVLPLFPLDGFVLLPGESLTLPPATRIARKVSGFGDAVVAALADGDAVHEIGVTAVLGEGDGFDEGQTALHGITRCRLLSLAGSDEGLVRAERFPEQATNDARRASLARLLDARYRRFCARVKRLGRSPRPTTDLSPLTWRITASLGLSTEQQQGLLNVPDPLTRGRLLLLTLRELEQRERFLRPWSHLRTATPWS